MVTFVSVLVFGLMYLLYRLSLIFHMVAPWLLLGLIAAAGIYIGLILVRKNQSKLYLVLLPCFFVGLFVAWGLCGYAEFRKIAKENANNGFVGRTDVPQQGFLVDDTELRKFRPVKSIQSAGVLFDAGRIGYYENYFNNALNGFKREVMRTPRMTLTNNKKVESQFVLKVLPVVREPTYFLFPIYKVTYQVQKIDDGTPIASRSEYIFGGGLLSSYLQAFFGDESTLGDDSYTYISIGYASENVLAWRSNVMASRSFQAYVEADADLVSSIIY